MATPGAAIFNFPQIYGNGIVFIVGSALFGSAGAIASTKGKGFTVTKTGTGAYTIVTNSSFASVLAASVDYNMVGGAEGLSAVRLGFTGNNTLTVNTVNTSGVATNSGVSGNGFDFIIAMSTSTLDS